MKTNLFNLLLLAAFLIQSCSGNTNKENAEVTSDTTSTEQVVNVYTHRHYETDQELFKKFTENTGIKVNVVNAGADELIKRMELEAEKSPADVLITADAGRLHKAKEMGLLQSIDSDVLENNVPSHLKDPDNQWFGLTYRARVIVYSKDRVKPAQLSTYEDLTSPKWKGKILVRSSENIYNQSLLASIIAANGKEGAKDWANGVKNNFAREPKGGDRDQMKAVAAGEGDIAIVNTYYFGNLLNSDDPEEKKAGEALSVYFPNQDNRGTHINVSGAGITKHAPNKENAVKFVEYLTSDEAQKAFAEANFEYPVKKDVEVSPILKSWGEFKADSLNLSELGKNNRDAVMIFDEIGWK